MLVLKRKRGEAVRIAERVVIRVLSTSHGSVTLGIEAPKGVKIIRMELEGKEERKC
jgi:carbon storage regulator CsrA